MSDQPVTPIDRTGDPVIGVPPGPRTARDWARLRMTDEILRVARDQLATVGAAGLSLRAIARDLGVASSAIYRYFPSRDDLLTALIVEAYNGMGATAEMAEARVPRADVSGRWAATCHAVRDWALAHPQQYALIYGTPVPGYRAPVDTVGPATRVSTLVTVILVDAMAAGRLAPHVINEPLDADVVDAMAPLLSQLPTPMPPTVLVRGVQVLAALFGAVSWELFGQFHNVIDETPEARRAFFGSLVRQWGVAVGLPE